MKRSILLIIFALLFAGCSGTSVLRYPPNRWLKDTDNTPIAKPKVKNEKKKKKEKNEYDQYTQEAQDVLKFTESMAQAPKNLTLGGRTEALDTNNFDEAADSTWFTNRIGRTGEYKNEFKTPPDLKHQVTVLSQDKETDPKELFIRDIKGNEYLVRYDGSADGLESSSELLGALFLHAAGYNVTENYIVTFNGKRALAIRVPKGDNLGPFLFNGKRAEDKNDRIPHEYRRALRGLRLFAAFLNNKTIGLNNNIDIYDGYITHYLSNLSLPFADLRSEFTGGAPIRASHTVDALFSFGMYNPYWTVSDQPEKKRSGIISSKTFEPDKWQPVNNNTAFKFMTLSDAFWAARIISLFSDDTIKAIVKDVDYKDKACANTVVNELIQRRDKIVDYYFSKISPFDDLSFIDDNDGKALLFTDLAAKDGTLYRYRIRNVKATVQISDWQVISSPRAPVSAAILSKMRPKEIYTLQLQLKRSGQDSWSASTEAYLKKDPDLQLIGLDRRYYH